MNMKYFLQLGGLSALWGTSFMLTRVAVSSLGPYLLATLRVALATVVLTIIMHILRHRWPLQHWRELLKLGAMAVAGPQVLYAWSAQTLPAGYGALLSVTSVLFGAFASAFLKEESLSAGKLLGCFLGFAGVALVVRLGPVAPSQTLVVSAIVCMTGSALSGMSTPLLKQAIARMEPLTITAGMHGAALMLMIPGAIYDFPSANFTARALGAVTVMGVVTSGLAYWMYMRIMRHVTPLAALSSTFMSTGFGVIWAIVLLHEESTKELFAGGALILLACFFVTGIKPLQRAPSHLSTDLD